jgi:hypothetical protein
MKNTIIIICSLLIISCSSETTESNSEEWSKTIIVDYFLTDITSLENQISKTPIKDFQNVANDIASKVIEMDKNNIEAVLTEAKEYKNCVIITGDHTIVKIISFDNCKQSGAWGACMPFAEGYIKKGELVKQKDYINNIIGMPDNQKRTAYLFE